MRPDTNIRPFSFFVMGSFYVKTAGCASAGLSPDQSVKGGYVYILMKIFIYKITYSLF